MSRDVCVLRCVVTNCMGRMDGLKSLQSVMQKSNGILALVGGWRPGSC